MVILLILESRLNFLFFVFWVDLCIQNEKDKLSYMLFHKHVHLISKIDHVKLCTPPPPPPHPPFPIGELAIKWNFEKWGFENMSFSCGDFQKRGSNFFLGGRDCFVKWLLKKAGLWKLLIIRRVGSSKKHLYYAMSVKNMSKVNIGSELGLH